MKGFHTLCADFRTDIRSRASSGSLTKQQEKAAQEFVKAMEDAVDNADEIGVKEARQNFNAAIPDNHPIYRHGYKVWEAYGKEYPKALQRKQSGTQYEEVSSTRTSSQSGGGWHVRNPFARKQQQSEVSSRQSAKTAKGAKAGKTVDERRAEVKKEVDALVDSFHASLASFEAMWRRDCRDHATDSFNETLVRALEDMREQSNGCRQWVDPQNGYNNTIESWFFSPRTLSKPGRNATEIRDLRNMWSDFKTSYLELRKKIDDVTWLTVF